MILTRQNYNDFWMDPGYVILGVFEMTNALASETLGPSSSNVSNEKIYGYGYPIIPEARLADVSDNGRYRYMLTD